MSLIRGPVADQVGFVVIRMLVPLWILAGAAFKLYERAPKYLPSSIQEVSKGAGIELGLVLRFAIGLELFAVGVMLLIPRFAKPMAIFMLSIFCIILLIEMQRQAKSCGCLGSIQVKPWQMLLIDGPLLAAAVLLRPGKRAGDIRSGKSLAQPLAAAAAILIAGLAIAFAVPDPKLIGQVAEDAPQHDIANQPSDTDPTAPKHVDPTINPAPKPLPHYWVSPNNPNELVGKPWREFELFQFMIRWPAGLDSGTHHVVFYSRTCEHCEEMFEQDLAIVDAPVTAVEIPHDKTVLRSKDAWPMPETNAALLTLPLGVDWMLTPPFVVTVVDGRITCAQEQDHKKCMGLK